MNSFEEVCDTAIENLDQIGVEIDRIRHRLDWIEQELDADEERERQLAAMPKYGVKDMVKTLVGRVA